MIKAKLPEVHLLGAPLTGLSHVLYRAYIMILRMEYCLRMSYRYVQGVRYTHNVKNEQSKRDINTTCVNVGLPKALKGYGNRGVVVPFLGRTPGFSVRSHNHLAGHPSTVSTDGVKRLQRIAEKCQNNHEYIIQDKLYNILYDIRLYEVAYSKLKSKPGNMTQGINSTTLDGMSKEVLENIIDQIRSGTFQFTPGRRVNIPKPKGGTRPLTVASPRDKIVQEVLRMILEAIYEPSFSPRSHGFRPNKSCHTALKELKSNFQAAS
jgi:hypothetical protein